MQIWAREAGRASISEETRLGIKTTIQEVTQDIHMAMGRRRIEKPAAMIRLVEEGFREISMPEKYAQAYDGEGLIRKDRCWRCRISLSFAWVGNEESTKDVD